MENIEDDGSDRMTILSISSRMSQFSQDKNEFDNEENKSACVPKTDSCRFEIPLSRNSTANNLEKKIERRRPTSLNNNKPGGYCIKQSNKCSVI